MLAAYELLKLWKRNYFILLVKMRNLSLTYCFIEWNNMI